MGNSLLVAVHISHDIDTKSLLQHVNLCIDGYKESELEKKQLTNILLKKGRKKHRYKEWQTASSQWNMYIKIHSRFQSTRVTLTRFSDIHNCIQMSIQQSYSQIDTKIKKEELHPSGVYKGHGRLLRRGQMKIHLYLSATNAFNFLTG